MLRRARLGTRHLAFTWGKAGRALFGAVYAQSTAEGSSASSACQSKAAAGGHCPSRSSGRSTAIGSFYSQACLCARLFSTGAAALHADDGLGLPGGSWGVRWDLYSLAASEAQQQHFLTVEAAYEDQLAAERAAAAQPVEGCPATEAAADACCAGEVAEQPERVLEAPSQVVQPGVEELAAEAAAAEPDFYEEFQPDRQLVLRSAWLCAGAGSLAAMRARLAQRILLLEALEEDGWQLDAPVDEYAVLTNAHPKPPQERRLVEAWEIVERWEQGVDWPSPDY